MRQPLFNRPCCIAAWCALPVMALGWISADARAAEKKDTGWAVATPPTLAPQIERPAGDGTSAASRLLREKQPLLKPDRDTSSSSDAPSFRAARKPLWAPGPSRSGQFAPPVASEPNWVSPRLLDVDSQLAPQQQSTVRATTMGPRLNAPLPQPAESADSEVKFRAPAPRNGREVTRGVPSQPERKLPRSPVRQPAEDTAEEPVEEPVEELVEEQAEEEVAEEAPHDAWPRAVKEEKPEAKTQAATRPVKALETQPKKPPPETWVVPDKEVKQEKPMPAASAPPLRPLSQYQKRLRTKVRRVLKMYYRRPLNSRDHDPWEMMHGMLAYGVHSRVLQNGPTGEPITAVGWLCYNKPCKRKKLLYVNPEGELRARWGVGVQGHYGQFLAMLAQARVAHNYPIRIGDRDFTIEDLIEAEKKTCQSGEELTFKLIALMHYCQSDAKWLNAQGDVWDIPRLIREELEQPIRGAACGGTHRLTGLGLAVRTRAKRGEPLDGEYLRAQQFVQKYQNYAFSFQNRDGSLSTNWFRGRGDEEDKNRRIKTSGHILEWLLYSLDDKQLHDRRIVRAVDYLASLMYGNFSHDWEIGPICHSIHALVLYDERVFQKYDGLEEPATRRPIAQRTRRQTNTRSRNGSRSGRR